MRYFIVHAHHEPASFNGALTAAATKALTEAGHKVDVSDLHAMGFDPVSDRRNFTTTANPEYLKQQAEETHATEHNGFVPELEAEMVKLESCDVLVFQFPLWWFGMPAILKGWCDRVLAASRVYGGGKWYDDGIAKGKRAMLSLTTGGPESMYSEDGLNGEMDTLLFPINHGVFRFLGFDVVPQHVVWGPARMTPEARSAAIESYTERLLGIAAAQTIQYPSLREFDPATFARKR